MIGANGTMGRNIAAIFASFGGARVYLISRTTKKSEEAKEKAFMSVRAECIREKMIPRDYSSLESCIFESELIFEACAEKWEVKCDIHLKIAEILRKGRTDGGIRRIVCSGTSGLSITKLSALYDERQRSWFFGMHFFNPPYQMTLCELISTKYANTELFLWLCEYAKSVLGRSVVKVKDSPAFLGNRIGFQFINEAIRMAEKFQYNGGIDYIDAILGPFTGRAMAPLVTANYVGLDVHKAITDNLYENTRDYAHSTFVVPQFVNRLIEKGNLGRKSGAGFYKTVVHDNGMKLHLVYDIQHGYYREIMKYVFPFAEEMVGALRVGDYAVAFQRLTANHSREAEICCELLLKYVVYGLKMVEFVGEGVHSADDAMAAGFNWCPPLAMIEAFGGIEVFEELCKERLESSVLKESGFGNLINHVEKSRYDYRRFIKAER